LEAERRARGNGWLEVWPVYVTAGGNHFHWYAHCPALADGQAQAMAAGYLPHEIVEWTEAGARGDGRYECRTCKAHRRFELAS